MTTLKATARKQTFTNTRRAMTSGAPKPANLQSKTTISSAQQRFKRAMTKAMSIRRRQLGRRLLSQELMALQFAVSKQCHLSREDGTYTRREKTTSEPNSVTTELVLQRFQLMNAEISKMHEAMEFNDLSKGCSKNNKEADIIHFMSESHLPSGCQILCKNRDDKCPIPPPAKVKNPTSPQDYVNNFANHTGHGCTFNLVITDDQRAALHLLNRIAADVSQPTDPDGRQTVYFKMDCEQCYEKRLDYLFEFRPVLFQIIDANKYNIFRSSTHWTYFWNEIRRDGCGRKKDED